ELILPVLTLRRGAPPLSTAGLSRWTLRPGSATLSTRFASITIEAESTGLLVIEEVHVRLVLREGRKVLSRVVAASYGFEEGTGIVRMQPAEGEARSRLKPSVVTLMLENLPKSAEIQVVLLDASLETELAKVTLPV